MPYLCAYLTGKNLALVQGLTIESYDSIKGRLLEAAGLTTTDAGAKLLKLEPKDIVGKTVLAVFQLVTRLIKRVYKGAVTVYDYVMALLIPVLRHILPKEGVAYLDQRAPTTTDALLEALQQWWSIDKSRLTEDRKPERQPGIPSPHRPGGFKCFNCGKMGHKVAECRSRPGMSSTYGSSSTVSSLTTGVKCFTSR